jgi:hypothetical protein
MPYDSEPPQVTPGLLFLLRKYSVLVDRFDKKVADNIYMLSNITLSKNHYSGTHLLRDLIEGNTTSYYLFRILIGTVIFYTRNGFYFFSWLVVYFYASLMLPKTRFSKEKDLSIIDTFYGINQIKNSYEFSDNYFDLLYRFLNKYKLPYYIMPQIFGVKRSPLRHITILRHLSKSHAHCINEMGLLKWSDIFLICLFIVRYPFTLNASLRRLDENSFFSLLLKNDMVRTLGRTTFHAYVRYLLGRRLRSLLPDRSLKIISWYENHPADKYFFSGVSGTDTAIYGCQYFLKYPTCAWHYQTDRTINRPTSPDYLLVNGPVYVPRDSTLRYRIGPSLRYSYIFQREKISPMHTRILILLSYIQVDSATIINTMANSTLLRDLPVDIKPHPDFSTLPDILKPSIPDNWSIVRDFSFADYNILITSGSGTSLEFACLGGSVLIVGSKHELTTHPFPEHGRGIVWEITSPNVSPDEKLTNLLKHRQHSKDSISDIADSYRHKYFSLTTDEIIKRNFDF